LKLQALCPPWISRICNAFLPLENSYMSLLCQKQSTSAF
jgi:hypothetical protein